MSLTTELTNQGNWLFKRRSYIPLLLLIPGLIIYFTRPSSDVRIEWIGFGITIIGVIIRMIAVGFSAKNTSGRNTHGQVADSLNTKGIYSIVRHPLYLGNYFMWLGIAIFTQHVWFILAFTLAYWIYYERIMYAEEEFISSKFEQSYTAWSASTPAFIPNPTLWQSEDSELKWSKLIVQEKSTILNLFLVINILVWGRLLLHRQIPDSNEFFWLIMLLSCLTSYIIIKVLQKRKSIA